MPFRKECAITVFVLRPAVRTKSFRAEANKQLIASHSTRPRTAPSYMVQLFRCLNDHLLNAQRANVTRILSCRTRDLFTGNHIAGGMLLQLHSMNNTLSGKSIRDRIHTDSSSTEGLYMFKNTPKRSSQREQQRREDSVQNIICNDQ